MIYGVVQLVHSGDPQQLGLDPAARAAHEDLLAKSYDRSTRPWSMHELPLKPLLTTPARYLIEVGDHLFSDPDFFARIPDARGLVFLSRVGFDPAERTALLYLQIRAMALSSRAGFVQLGRRGASWEIERELVLLIS